MSIDNDTSPITNREILCCRTCLLHGQISGNHTITHNGKKKTLKEYFGGAHYLLENALTPFDFNGCSRMGMKNFSSIKDL